MALGVNTSVLLARPSAGGPSLLEAWPTDVLFAQCVGKFFEGIAQATAPAGASPFVWADTSGGTSNPAVWKTWTGPAWAAAESRVDRIAKARMLSRLDEARPINPGELANVLPVNAALLADISKHQATIATLTAERDAALARATAAEAQVAALTAEQAQAA